jgi:hypothetical protein
MTAIYDKKIVLVIMMSISLLVHAQKYSEYEVKASFLEKFTRFIEWPPELHLEDLNKPFVIGVIGQIPFKPILDKMYDTQKIKNKKVDIRYISDLDKITGCHLLYISQSEYKRIDQILPYINGLPILTVCDDMRYAKKGIQIILFVKNNYVYFTIDQNAVNKSGLYMNTLLLKMSKPIN